MGDWWWTKWNYDRFSLLFYLLSIIPTKLQTQFHLPVAVNRTNGRNLGTFQKVNFFRKWEGMGYKNRHTVTFSVLKVLIAGGTFILPFRPSTVIVCLRQRDTLCYHETILFSTARSFQIIPMELRSPYHLRDVTLCQFVSRQLSTLSACKYPIRNLYLSNDQYALEQWTLLNTSFV